MIWIILFISWLINYYSARALFKSQNEWSWGTLIAVAIFSMVPIVPLVATLVMFALHDNSKPPKWL
jgi:hypothetical protein